MTNHCTPEEKQHMVDLVEEIRGYLVQIPTMHTKPMSERLKVADRMKSIRKEMEEFRRKYPDD